MTRSLDLNFTGRRAAVLHPAATVRDQLVARLAALGVEAVCPQTGADLARSDFAFIDVDTGHDEQIPWAQGTAPIPLIGLIRSEAPGRLAWALGHRFDAFLSPTALGSVYSTMVIATARAADRRQAAERDAEIARRAGLRHMVVRATLAIMEREGVDERAALKRLRQLAMRGQLALEDAAVHYLSQTDIRHAGQRK